jgi:hypothetical protein
MYRPVCLHSKFHKNIPDLYRGANKLRRILKSKIQRNTRLASIYGFGIQVTATSTFLDIAAFV